MNDTKKPLGVQIFGGLNCCVFGFLFLAVFLITYLKVTPEDLASVTALFKEKGFAMPLSYRQFKILILVYVALASLLAISGAGLLKKKEWARKVTVHFSFIWLLLIFLTALLNPALITQVITYAVYPGILVIYFTNKRIETYFKT